jgi:hypothetical protein
MLLHVSIGFCTRKVAETYPHPYITRGTTSHPSIQHYFKDQKRKTQNASYV